MLTFIYFIIILGLTVLVHEFGHFIFAKKSGVYVYEFSIGMGPRLFKFKRKKDPTEYSIRLFPIGGYVSMAGENTDVDDKIPLESHMFKKDWLHRVLIIIAGVLFNFIFALILLFIIGIVNGNNITKPYINTLEEGYSISSANVESGDLIRKINGKSVDSVDMFLLEMQVNNGSNLELELESKDGTLKTVTIEPKLVEVDEKEEYKYGFSLETHNKKGVLEAIKYAFVKIFLLLKQMVYTIFYLITGKLSISNLSGPIGIYTVVGEASSLGFINIVYLEAFLCVNVGFVNIIPFPAFDGGRLLFLIIEKIKGSPVSPKVENTIHSIGFILLILLMIVVSFNDIIKLF